MKIPNFKVCFILFFLLCIKTFSQYIPEGISAKEISNAQMWADQIYKTLSEDEKLGQLFIVALYTNKGEDHIQNVRQLVEEEQLGGLIIMQDDAVRHAELLNELQSKSKVPMLVGMDAEWGLFQRISKAHKLPWAITLGAVQNKKIITEYASQIAKDAKNMGINWNFAPVVDVNTNPNNPIIGNRSFGSEVKNVIRSAEAYICGLQNNQILAAIKHFPGHGDTHTDSHLDLPVVSHSKRRLSQIELAPFKALAHKNIGGVMVAHLYVPALERQEGIPASVSYDIITGILKNQLKYQGLIITDALNMGAVAKRFKPGELDAMAFQAGNDLMLFSEGVKEGKNLIKKAIENGSIPQKRLEESVKKILITKYFLGLTKFSPIDLTSIDQAFNTKDHRLLAQKVYTHALTLLKDKKHLLPLKLEEIYYYVPLEEAPYQTLVSELSKEGARIIIKKANEIEEIPKNSKVLIGFHKDNSTAYKPYQISKKSQSILKQLSQNHSTALIVLGSPYGLKDINLKSVSTLLVGYENNDDSMIAIAKALLGKSRIQGRLPVEVNKKLKAGAGKNKF